MTKCVSGLAVFVVTFGLFAACGGTALRDGSPGGAGAGNESGAGSGTAGATSRGGAGSGVGGRAAAAGAPSVAGAPGSAGSTSSGACAQPKLSGNCDAYIPAFWHNPQTGLCEPFVYGGCGGNDNRFPSREACIQTCGGGGEDMGQCALETDCTVVNLDCCGCEPIDDQRLVAMNAKYQDNYASHLCANVGACAPCPAPGELQATGKYFKPVCVSGQCSVIDIRSTKHSVCGSPADCVLRNGTSCCQQCDQSGWVAVNRTADFCGDGPTPCDACASAPPNGLTAACGADGVCKLAYLLEK